MTCRVEFDQSLALTSQSFNQTWVKLTLGRRLHFSSALRSQNLPYLSKSSSPVRLPPFGSYLAHRCLYSSSSSGFVVILCHREFSLSTCNLKSVRACWNQYTWSSERCTGCCTSTRVPNFDWLSCKKKLPSLESRFMKAWIRLTLMSWTLRSLSVPLPILI